MAKRQITARAKSSAKAGSADSAFIDAMYALADRHRDHAGLPERATPVMAAPRKPWKDPAKFAVVESPEIRARKAQLAWAAKFRNHVDAVRQAQYDANEMAVALRSKPETVTPKREPGVAPTPDVICVAKKDKLERIAWAKLLAANAAEAMERALAMPETDEENVAYHQAKADLS